MPILSKESIWGVKLKILAEIFFLYKYWKSFVYFARKWRSIVSTSPHLSDLIFMFLESVSLGEWFSKLNWLWNGLEREKFQRNKKKLALYFSVASQSIYFFMLFFFYKFGISFAYFAGKWHSMESTSHHLSDLIFMFLESVGIGEWVQLVS